MAVGIEDLVVPDEPHMRLELLSQPRLLAACRAMISQFARRLGFSEPACSQISLAVDEALCNVINHGYDRRPTGRIWVSLWALDAAPQGVQIVIEDLARQVDPKQIRSRDLDDIRPGGLGVHLIREIMDHVNYEQRSSGGMRVTMVKIRDSDDRRQNAESVEAVEEGSA